MGDYDYDAFLASILGLDHRQDMIDRAEVQAAIAENSSYKIKGAAAAREAGSLQFSKNLKDLLFWLRNEARPSMMEDRRFRELKPLAEKLVKNGEMNKEVLGLFTEL